MLFAPCYCKGSPAVCLVQISAFSITSRCGLTVRKIQKHVCQTILCIISDKLNSMPVCAAYGFCGIFSSLITFYFTASAENVGTSCIRNRVRVFHTP